MRPAAAPNPRRRDRARPREWHVRFAVPYHHRMAEQYHDDTAQTEAARPQTEAARPEVLSRRAAPLPQGRAIDADHRRCLVAAVDHAYRHAGDAAHADAPDSACAALSDLKIPAASIGLPPRARWCRRRSGGRYGGRKRDGEYCAVRGNISPVDPNAPGHGIRGQSSQPLEFEGAANGRRRVRWNLGDGARRRGIAIDGHGSSPEAGVRHPRERRRPQGRSRLRRQICAK